MAGCNKCEKDFGIVCVDEKFLGIFSHSWILVNKQVAFIISEPVRKCPYVLGKCTQKEFAESIKENAKVVSKRAKLR